MSLKHDGRKNNKLTKENFLHENLKTNYSANKKQIGNQFNLGVRCDGSNNLDPVEMDPKNPDPDQTMLIRSEADMLSCCTG